MLGGEIKIAVGECDKRGIGDGARAAAVRAGGLSLPPQNGVEQAETAGVDGEDQGGEIGGHGVDGAEGAADLLGEGTRLEGRMALLGDGLGATT